MINITKWPVIIVANYRTGSTVFAQHLAKINNVPVYLEPWQHINAQTSEFNEHIHWLKKDFYDHYKSGNTMYVLKVMPDQIHKDTPYEKILASDSFKIKLHRENEIDNIISQYISNMRQKWVTEKNEPYYRYTLPIDYNVLLAAITSVTRGNFYLNNLNYEFDQDLSYESLGEIKSSIFEKTRPPENINEIRAAVVTMFNNLF